MREWLIALGILVVVAIVLDACCRASPKLPILLILLLCRRLRMETLVVPPGVCHGIPLEKTADFAQSIPVTAIQYPESLGLARTVAIHTKRLHLPDQVPPLP